MTMNTEDFDRMMAALRDGTGCVKLDFHSPGGSSTLAVTNENVRRAAEANQKGARCAYLFIAEHKHWQMMVVVTGEQAHQLTLAGAKPHRQQKR
jgi:hypothetical protein